VPFLLLLFFGHAKKSRCYKLNRSSTLGTAQRHIAATPTAPPKESRCYKLNRSSTLGTAQRHIAATPTAPPKESRCYKLNRSSNVQTAQHPRCRQFAPRLEMSQALLYNRKKFSIYFSHEVRNIQKNLKKFFEEGDTI